MYYQNATGLGFTYTPQDSGVTGGLVSTATNFVADLVPIPGFNTIVNTISNAFHIGSGRKEADMITPVQNQFGDFLAQVSTAIGAATTVAQLQDIANKLSQAWNQFQAFIDNRNQFPDGRASAGARATLQPLVQGFQTGIADKIRQLGGARGPMALTQDAGVFNLSPLVYGEPMIPQAGTLTPQYATLYQQPGAMDSILPFALAAGVGWFLFR